MNDGTLYVWGKNDRGQMGVGAGNGIDFVECEVTPKEVDFQEALPEKDRKEPVIITDVCTGSRTMLAKDSKERVYKTGLKIDYTPKLINFNHERMEKARILACGMRYYAVVDNENNIHAFGKLFKEKTDEQYDGFEIYDSDKLFDSGKILDLTMKYEVLGALVEHPDVK
jgi:alpha-tubulin suppressor-like RCC1 family protein